MFVFKYNLKNRTETSQLLIIILQTAKMNCLKLDKYIKYNLESIDNIKISRKDTLLPFDTNLIDYLKTIENPKIKKENLSRFFSRLEGKNLLVDLELFSKEEAIKRV